MNTDTPFFNPLHTADSSCRTQMEQSKPKIPRPLNCFMVFRLEKQREIVRRCPGANHRDISKIISKWWKELSAEDKKPYIAEADRRKIKHREMHPNYKFSPLCHVSKQTSWI
ncbi:high mobility group box domain-containing protein, partial [Gilbertella persicaria]|uniref:high mobility group box domain-containing protein n=1 Tax=Gilbertella persicaria TaxID=101096 RepID=UPI00221F2EE5